MPLPVNPPALSDIQRERLLRPTLNDRLIDSTANMAAGAGAVLGAIHGAATGIVTSGISTGAINGSISGASAGYSFGLEPQRTLKEQRNQSEMKRHREQLKIYNQAKKITDPINRKNIKKPRLGVEAASNMPRSESDLQITNNTKLETNQAWSAQQAESAKPTV